MIAANHPHCVILTLYDYSAVDRFLPMEKFRRFVRGNGWRK